VAFQDGASQTTPTTTKSSGRWRRVVGNTGHVLLRNSWVQYHHCNCYVSTTSIFPSTTVPKQQCYQWNDSDIFDHFDIIINIIDERSDNPTGTPRKAWTAN
jgi:hypothetical protein